jgi:hypothetical protein
MTYPATAILLRDETVEHCRERKAAAILAAEVLAAKAHSPAIAGYWCKVQEMAWADLQRLEEIQC